MGNKSSRQKKEIIKISNIKDHREDDLVASHGHGDSQKVPPAPQEEEPVAALEPRPQPPELHQSPKIKNPSATITQKGMSNADLQDELVRERRLHQTIAENIVLEEFKRDIRDFYYIDNDEVLGKGCTGSVRAGTRLSTNVKYAIKTLRKLDMSHETRRKYHQEITIMTKLDHPNIIRLHEYFENDHTIYLVLDLCSGGELLDHLNSQYHHKFDEFVVQRYIKEILGAVIYLHAHGIIHRDLKLENFLLEDDRVDAELKLIDFGLSMFMDKRGLAYDPVGTPFYVAPEVLHGSYDAKCDVWSIGVMTYMMLSGRPPFYGKNDQEILLAVENDDPDLSRKRFPSASPAALDFIALCLDRNTTRRPAAVDLLGHPFFRSVSEAERVATMPSFNVIRQLTSFLKRPLFYKLCLEAVAFSLSNDQIVSLREQFHAFDSNNSGYITYKDLHYLVSGLNVFLPPDRELTNLASSDEEDAVDEEDSRLISYHEFIAATTSAQLVTEQNLKVAFDVLSDHAEFIELRSVKHFLGSEVHGRPIRDVLADVNLDLDSRLSYDQFKEFVISEYQNSMKDGATSVSGGACGSSNNTSINAKGAYKAHSSFMDMFRLPVIMKHYSEFNREKDKRHERGEEAFSDTGDIFPAGVPSHHSM